MAISVPIPKEIREYEEKIMFGLSIRKLICFSTAVVFSVGTYFLCTKLFGLTMDMTSYIIIIEAMPLMALGFIKKNGMPFEKYIALYVRHKIGMNKLSYKTDLIINMFSDTIDNTTTEGGSKYVRNFKKENNTANTSTAGVRECEIFKITKESHKRKNKAALRQIETARQEYRAAVCRAEKET